MTQPRPAGSVAHCPEGDLDALRSELGSLGRVVVAFSGGTDSAFLAWVATDTLGAGRVLCATAVSPSLATEELADCRALAGEWGLRAVEVVTEELADPAYAVNDRNRCAHCKSALLSALVPLAEAEGIATSSAGVGRAAPAVGGATIVLGVNLDDLDDHRPGQVAAAAAGAVFPLVNAGFTKEAVRAWSRTLGLRTWDKPAAACLASRVPYGTPVTVSTLRSVADAESGLRALGYRQLRVRHYGDTARIEVPGDDLNRVVADREAVTSVVHGAGYRYVTLDLDGFRSGNLNGVLQHGSSATRSSVSPPTGVSEHAELASGSSPPGCLASNVGGLR